MTAENKIKVLEEIKERLSPDDARTSYICRILMDMGNSYTVADTLLRTLGLLDKEVIKKVEAHPDVPSFTHNRVFLYGEVNVEDKDFYEKYIKCKKIHIDATIEHLKNEEQ